MKKIFTTALAAILLIPSIQSRAQQSERLPFRNPNSVSIERSIPLPPGPQLRTSNKREVVGSFSSGTTMVTLTSGTDRLVNNNNGAVPSSQFTQSETSTVAFGDHIVIGYNDAGSFSVGSHFTGFSYSDDGGGTFTDGGPLPVSAGG